MYKTTAIESVPTTLKTFSSDSENLTGHSVYSAILIIQPYPS